VFTKLLTEDLEYRAFFAKLFDEITNHRVTPAFLRERFDFYRRIAVEHDIRDRRYIVLMRRFIERRPAFVRRLVEMYLNKEPSLPVIVKNPSAQTLLVDGFAVSTDYEGQYLPETELTLEVPQRLRGQFRGWIVNGQALPEEELIFSTDVRSALTISAEFR
jgi:hypothetical protein